MKLPHGTAASEPSALRFRHRSELHSARISSANDKYSPCARLLVEEQEQVDDRLVLLVIPRVVAGQCGRPTAVAGDHAVGGLSDRSQQCRGSCLPEAAQQPEHDVILIPDVPAELETERPVLPILGGDDMRGDPVRQFLQRRAPRQPDGLGCGDQPLTDELAGPRNRIWIAPVIPQPAERPVARLQIDGPGEHFDNSRISDRRREEPIFLIRRDPLADIDLIELNEAFAAQTLAVTREWKLTPSDFDRLNVNGSGISLRHPVGATGGRILATLSREMHRRDARYGLETMCIGGGQGIAAVFETVR